MSDEGPRSDGKGLGTDDDGSACTRALVVCQTRLVEKSQLGDEELVIDDQSLPGIAVVLLLVWCDKFYQEKASGGFTCTRAFVRTSARSMRCRAR